MPTIEEILLGKSLDEKLEPEEAVEVIRDNLAEEVLSVEESAEMLGLKPFPSDEEVIQNQVEEDGGLQLGIDFAKGSDETSVVVVGRIIGEVVDASEVPPKEVMETVAHLGEAVRNGEISPEDALQQLKALDKEISLPFAVASEFVEYREFKNSSRFLDDGLMQKAQEELQKNEQAIEILTGSGISEMVRLAEAKKETRPIGVTVSGTVKPEKASCDYETLDLNDLGAQVPGIREIKPIPSGGVFVMRDPEYMGKMPPRTELKVASNPDPNWKPPVVEMRPIPGIIGPGIIGGTEITVHREKDITLSGDVSVREGPPISEALFVKDPEPSPVPLGPSLTEAFFIEEVDFEGLHTASPAAGVADLVDDIGFDEELSMESGAPKVAYEVVDSVSSRHGRVVLIDGSNMAMRCFFPLKDMCRSDGRPTGLLFGMLKSIRAIQRDCNALPVLVWDAGGTKKKREIYAEYKGNRGVSDTKAACFEELENVREWLRYLGIPQALKLGEEADDVIGSMAYGTFKDAFVFIYSSDDDFLQLVDDSHCVVVKPSKEGPVFYDSEKVEERLGVPPELVPMFRCLRGDKSDNLPGIPNFLSKKIVELVTEHCSIEDLWSNPEENFKKLTPKSRAKISGFKEQAEINLKVMTIDRSIKPEIQVAPFNAEGLRDLFKEMEFASYLGVFEEWGKDFRGHTGFMKTG